VEHGLVILTPISFHTTAVVLVPVGKTCVNVKLLLIPFLYTHTYETCNVSIVLLHVQDRVMCEMMTVARVLTG